MNGKKARQMRKLLSLDITDPEVREQGIMEKGTKLIAQIQQDGNHTSREQVIEEVRTTTDRYLYRQLKRVYSEPNKEKDIRKQLLSDLNGGSNE